MKAVGYRVIIKPDEIKEITESGLHIVRDKYAESEIHSGVVVDIGPLAWRAFDKDEFGRPCGEPWAKVGDRVVYVRNALRKFLLDELDEEYGFVQDEDIIAVLESEE